MSKRLNSHNSNTLSQNEAGYSGSASKVKRTHNFFARSNGNEHGNVLLKLLNRQHSGYFATNLNIKSHQEAFKEVPNHLRFCLKEIVPYCYLQGHIFMGLSACGQFLLSYKVSYEYEESITNYYNFTSAYKYELFFWIYRPHFLLSKYFNVRLFDDHGVDDIKTVTITQWSTDQQTLIVHGASEIDEHDSYITVVRVPKLGCLDCKEMRDEESDGTNRQDILCIKCNLTIHTKYRNSDSGPKFNPKYNLNCPGFIIMSENSFIHTVHIDLDMKKNKKAGSNVISYNYIGKSNFQQQMDDNSKRKLVKDKEKMLSPDIVNTKANDISNNVKQNCDKKLSIADEIIADFAEYEIETVEHKYSSAMPSASSSSTSSLSALPYSSSSTTTNTFSLIKPSDGNFDELVITCSRGDNLSKLTENASDKSNIRLLNHRNNTNIELKLLNKNNKSNVSKSYVTTIDLQSGASSSSNSLLAVASSSAPSPMKSSKRSYLSSKMTESFVPNNSNRHDNYSSNSPSNNPEFNTASIDVAAKAYEFSEDNEKCEKISTFRKRRLADKKYEFSEDNNNEENIVPFNRIRNQVRTRLQHQQHQQQSPSQNILFNSSQPNYELTSHLHRASPNHGFRSPCGSPVGNRYLKSPPGMRSPSYYRQRSPSSSSSSSFCNTRLNHQMMSPKQLIKKTTFDPKDFNIQILSPSSSGNDEIPKFFMDAIQKLSEKKLNNENNINSDNLNQLNFGGIKEQKNEKPICSKKFVKIYVEEDDANSVVTTEEDDCISPGYHTSLPMEVHGSCYSNMQIISQASYNKLKCPAIIITQNSFDMETFSFHVASYICSQNDKKYGILFDSAYELTHVCPLTETITCTMVLQFTANDTNKIKLCHNCSNTIDCLTHRKIFQCRSLFSWNMKTGDWVVLDYGNLSAGPYLEIKKLASNYNRLLNKLRKFTWELFNANPDNRTYDYLNHLRILDSNYEKTKNRLVDTKNMMEFYRRHINDMSSDSESDDYDDSDASWNNYNNPIVGGNLSDNDDIQAF